MKNAVLVVLSIVLLAGFFPRPASAEVTFDLGIRGGISLAKIMEVLDSVEDPSSTLTRPVLGGFIAINVNRMFTFQPELYYLNQGGVWNEEFMGSAYEWLHTQRYIHIPLLVKIHVMPEGRTIPIVFAGPAVDFLLSAREKLTIDGTVEYDDDLKPALKSTNFSLVFGGGVEMMLDKLKLILDIRYNLGLANIVAAEFADGWSLKTKAVMIVAGVGF